MEKQNKKQHKPQNLIMEYSYLWVGLFIIIFLIVITLSRSNINICKSNTYESGRLSIKCESFCESFGMNCIEFNGPGCHLVQSEKNMFVCKKTETSREFYLD